MVGVFAAVGGFSHAGARPASIGRPIVAGHLVLAIVTTALALGRGGSMVGRSRSVVLITALAVPFAVCCWLVGWHGTYVEPYERVGVRCALLTLVTAAALFTALALVRRHTSTRPITLGAAIGAVAGGWASLLVDAWCPLTNAPHVILGHSLPVAALVAIGAFVGGRVLSVRPRS